MTRVGIVGGGPAGLSAALFTAKNDLDAIVFDAGESWLHKAHLYNYLGNRNMDGSVFLDRSREQVTRDHGAEIEDAEVTEIESDDGDGFTIITEEDERHVDYVVLATGANRDIAEDLGCAFDEDDTVDVTLDMETSIDNVYATGAMVRPEKWQAIISAGDGGAAALDILSKEKGEHFHDFDTPSDVVNLPAHLD